ncbi:hypothetical protein BBP40_012456 [Aspergillus hancockii]|nr:hypothetical protein BBP40_012456 [Aspergillus hancockii]
MPVQIARVCTTAWLTLAIPDCLVGQSEVRPTLLIIPAETCRYHAFDQIKPSRRQCGSSKRLKWDLYLLNLAATVDSSQKWRYAMLLILDCRRMGRDGKIRRHSKGESIGIDRVIGGS